MFDAIVVGARCDGSPTAMLLTRRGYRVLLVDRATFPSDTVSTHFIWAPGVACLKRCDAGYHKDTLTAQGITHAFRSAELLTEAIHPGFSGARPMKEAMSEYQRLRDEQLRPHVRADMQLGESSIATSQNAVAVSSLAVESA